MEIKMHAESMKRRIKKFITLYLEYFQDYIY